jgi:hypothetical protein
VNQVKWGTGNVDLVHAAASQMKCRCLITAALSQNRPVLPIAAGCIYPRNFTTVDLEIGIELASFPSPFYNLNS